MPLLASTSFRYSGVFQKPIQQSTAPSGLQPSTDPLRGRSARRRCTPAANYLPCHAVFRLFPVPAQSGHSRLTKRTPLRSVPVSRTGTLPIRPRPLHLAQPSGHKCSGSSSTSRATPSTHSRDTLGGCPLDRLSTWGKTLLSAQSPAAYPVARDPSQEDFAIKRAAESVEAIRVSQELGVH